MNNRQRAPRRNRLSVALLTALVLPFAGAAWAQDPQDAANDEDTAGETAREADVTQIDTITVTGSRIRRAGFDTLEPAVVVTRQAIEAQGLTNIADALNRTPGFAGSLTPDGGQSSFNVGTNFVNRFNLGTNRTLSLVNGRRFVSSNPASQFSGVSPACRWTSTRSRCR